MAIAVGASLFALLPMFVVPALAVTCPDNGTLTNANVTPGSGSTSTKFTFSVTYQDNLGEAPTSARVYLSGPTSAPRRGCPGRSRRT